MPFSEDSILKTKRSRTKCCKNKQNPNFILVSGLSKKNVSLFRNYYSLESGVIFLFDVNLNFDYERML